MAMEKEAVESRGKRKQVRKILEFLKYDGQLIFEPQWYSRTNKEESNRSND